MERITFVDSEISKDSGKVCDLGAVKANDEQLHSPDQAAFSRFVADAEFICGHNIIHHDLKYIGELLNQKQPPVIVDTLYVSPLLFPRKPYHNLLKDDKLQTEALNNPLNDALKARDLFFDEINAFQKLPNRLKWIFCALLFQFPEFEGFFKYNKFRPYPLTDISIKTEFEGEICTNADIDVLIKHYPLELAYALAIIACDDKDSITPPWVLKNYPKVENVIKHLRYTPCKEGCGYCKGRLDVHKQLKRIFGFPDFRKYNGEPLQEKAAIAAVEGQSLLAVFPTGGGKSVTFQLPALMAGETIHGLTIVISPLQSLMKDQVDNLEEKGITDAVTINGLLSPIERAEAVDRVISGKASLLYISPEQLRSKTIEKLLTARNIARFVIDEAHCFSAWGQDFRVDYLYIGDFIRELQKRKGLKTTIPVSCFTATAKQKVISDICDYFKKKLDLDLKLFATDATRENLHYSVLFKETDEEKYNALRSLIEARQCPTIVYVSRTHRTYELAEKLTADGFPAKPFNGKMESSDKIANQEAFINNEIQVIVATSAFGMGVDKKDVRLVIHYDISDSLENYVQEAGRAGRDQTLEAECFVLFNDSDLDKHFILLNQTKLTKLTARMKESLGTSVQSDAGIVSLTHYTSANLEEPVVTQIVNRKAMGKVCVLTNTNDEALRIVGLLLKNDRRAKLIQSMDGFQLNNLTEIRYFLNEIDKRLSSPVISDEIWNLAKNQLKAFYKSSECLENCLQLISEFETINKTKYRTDLEEFIRESKYEDFYSVENDTVFVSTIHKAKGREFDCVYMMLNNVVLNDDEQKRKIYVGITRAKEELHIHYNTNIFIDAPVDITEDTRTYSEPETLILQFTHRDVVLDFFKEKDTMVRCLRSGDILQLREGYLAVPVKGQLCNIVKLSKACLEKVRQLNDKGYIPVSAKVRYVVLWRGKDDKKETAIVLPEIAFGKVKLL